MEGLFGERQGIARKHYDCTICGRIISKGTEYTRARWKPEWHASGDKPIDAKLGTCCYTPAHLPRDGKDGYEDTRRHYGAPARLGMKVSLRGIQGTLLRGDLSLHGHLVVKIGTKRQPDFWHPTWETVYYNNDGTIAADYRKQKETGVA